MIDSSAAKGMSRQGLLALIDTLARVDQQVTDAERVDQLAALERVKGACAAAQARVTAAFVASQERVQTERRREREANGSDSAVSHDSEVSAARRGHLGRGIAGQVALARRESPARGSQHVKLALALVHEMPNTYGALASGRLSEARAEIIVRESAHLSGEQRTGLDAELVVISRPGPVGSEECDEECDDDDDDGAGLGGVGSLGDRELTRRVRALAYRADPDAAAERCAKAALERRVELRHAAEAMCRLTAYLPLAQALAAHAALTAAADTARAGGDSRRKGQVMADTLVERVTGQATADAVPVEVALVITPESLFDADDTPAQVPGYGTVPAEWARAFLTHDIIPDQRFDAPSRPFDAPSRPFDARSAGPGGTCTGAARFDLRGGSEGDSNTEDDSTPEGKSDLCCDAEDETIDAYGGPDTAGDEFGGFTNPESAREQGGSGGQDAGAGGAGRRRVRDPQQRSRSRGTRPPPLPGGAPARSDRQDVGNAGVGDAPAGNDEAAERARVWLRRLYAHPKTGQLVAMDSIRRVFDGNLRRFLIARDAGTCRTPWCDAPIRHLDHIRDFADGGPTSAANGQGLCARCNHTKNHPDWHARTVTPVGGVQHTTATTTPTGHTYRSTSPPLVPAVPASRSRVTREGAPSAQPLSAFESYVAALLAG